MLEIPYRSFFFSIAYSFIHSFNMEICIVIDIHVDLYLYRFVFVSVISIFLTKSDKVMINKI